MKTESEREAIKKPSNSASESKPNALHLIHKWSIEHPYAVIAFYVARTVIVTAAVYWGFSQKLWLAPNILP